MAFCFFRPAGTRRVRRARPLGCRSGPGSRPSGSGGGRGHSPVRPELLHGRVIEELGQWLVGLWEVAGKDQGPIRCVAVVPVAQPLEDGAAQSASVPDGDRRQRLSCLARSGRRRCALRIGLGYLPGEVTQCLLDSGDRHRGRAETLNWSR